MDQVQNGTTDVICNDMDYWRKREDEHLMLQRQVRAVQMDRQHRTMGIHPKFRRQDKLLRVLKAEYVNIVKDLKVAKSGAHKKNDKIKKLNLKKSLLHMTAIKQEKEGGLNLMEELDGLLQKNSKHVLNLKKNMTTKEGMQQEKQYQTINRLASMENKLETAMLRFNNVQYDNKKIREEIEHMLKDRTFFNHAWTKMLNALTKGKKFLSDLFESSTLAYDQREEWCTKLRNLLEKGKMDQMMQVEEMRDLQKSYDHEIKLYEFLSRKGIMRVNTHQAKKEEAKKLKEYNESVKELEDHVKILDDLNSYTNEPDIERIIEAFAEREHKNHSIFKLLVEYCAESEFLKRDLNRIRTILDDRRDWNEMLENKRMEKLEKLNSFLEEQNHRNEILREKNQEHDKFISNIVNKTADMFRILDCSMEPFQNLLGDKMPTVHTYNLTLELITSKIKEYVEGVYFQEHVLYKKRDKDSACTSSLKKYTVFLEPNYCWVSPAINYLVPADPCPSCVEARWMSRVSDAHEVPFDSKMALSALRELKEDPAFERSDRIHQITDCRLPKSRAILAKRYL